MAENHLSWARLDDGANLRNPDIGMRNGEVGILYFWTEVLSNKNLLFFLFFDTINIPMEKQAYTCSSLFLYPFGTIAVPKKERSFHMMILPLIPSVLQDVRKTTKGTTRIEL